MWLCKQIDDYRWALLRDGVVVFVGSKDACVERWRIHVTAGEPPRWKQDQMLVKAIDK